MKVGRDRPRLSERLAKANEADRDENNPHDAENGLQPLSLESFTNDCRAISTAALTTIERDMAGLVATTRDMIAEASVEISRELSLTAKAARWRLIISITFALILIAASLLTSFWFSRSILREARDTSLAGIGLQTHQVQSGIVLTWDETRLRIGSCQSGKTSKPCLLPVQR